MEKYESTLAMKNKNIEIPIILSTHFIDNNLFHPSNFPNLNKIYYNEAYSRQY
jgi:hypothetical protein